MSSGTPYTGPQTQNKLITLCGKFIQSNIVNRVNASGCFSILDDEATDISCTARLSLCVRYVDKHTTKHCVLPEDFLEFVPVYDLTCKILAHSILCTLRSQDFDLTLLCGQGYDCAASMSWHLNPKRC
ncbi:hypothetical protein HPB48_008289 [Haemaphysalis longicornis]|uniref:DUF4371 domain-containing protein n=1 Tax=Haemaphysalis longicornis TaxID=44386 RepID=A0A9J6GPD6_HAELO|nr:hypothetical protein HPB48_008289 [Haemaphysalis longicornis]